MVIKDNTLHVDNTNFQTTLSKNAHHFNKLLQIIKDSGEILEGDCLYRDRTFFRHPGLVIKQENLFSIAQEGDKILEIGFNAGHSALIFLLSNPNCHVTTIDICEHSYTRKCAEYLKSVFPDRLTFLEGDSTTVLDDLSIKGSRGYDIFHIDGSHDKNVVKSDLQSCWELAHDDLTNKQSIVIFDDTWLLALKEVWEHAISINMVIPLSINLPQEAMHSMGYLNRPKADIAILSMTIGKEYKSYTKYGKRGKIEYSLKHGYAFHDDEDVLDKTRPIAWSKVLLILRYIQKYKYVAWIDADTYVMNCDSKIEDIISTWSNNRDILLTSDWKLPNTGVMFIKNTPWCHYFWCWIYTKISFIHHPNWEQSAFIDAYENDEFDAKSHITLLHCFYQRLFNSYWFNFEPGDFILHFPGCFRDDVNNGLNRVMVKFCPIKTDEDTEETYRERLRWIKEESVADAARLRNSQ